MKVVITGASGLIGSALARSLNGDGHEVVRLVRREARARDEAQWDPASRRLDAAVLDGADAVVNLAGAGIGDRRWSDGYKKLVLDSRVDATTTIATAIAELPEADRPRVLLSASAVGYYGDTGDEAVDESRQRGDGFLADVVERWEQAATPAADAGVRVVTVRSGVVLAAHGGALGKVLPLFKLGLGGRLGSGKQWMSWIALPDEVAALRFLLDRDDVSGAVNLTAPEPVRNRDYTKAIARAVHRPALATVPPVALRAALGGFADEGVLVSQRVLPGRLEDAGFAFTYADVDAALAAIID
ncbi:MAG TPA: TIGR01777 family oxidoreductase [Mycobacteriales bacterium]|nr:TIGR01777 family oxidoreductase [Mycobacteriales bacterium]